MEIRSLKDTIEKKRKEIEDLEEDQIKQLEIKQQEMDRLKGIIENKAEEIEKLETLNDIPVNEIPSECTNISMNITIIGITASAYNQ